MRPYTSNSRSNNRSTGVNLVTFTPRRAMQPIPTPSQPRQPRQPPNPIGNLSQIYQSSARSDNSEHVYAEPIPPQPPVTINVTNENNLQPIIAKHSPIRIFFSKYLPPESSFILLFILSTILYYNFSFPNLYSVMVLLILAVFSYISSFKRNNTFAQVIATILMYVGLLFIYQDGFILNHFTNIFQLYMPYLIPNCFLTLLVSITKVVCVAKNSSYTWFILVVSIFLYAVLGTKAIFDFNSLFILLDLCYILVLISPYEIEDKSKKYKVLRWVHFISIMITSIVALFNFKFHYLQYLIDNNQNILKCN